MIKHSLLRLFCFFVFLHIPICGYAIEDTSIKVINLKLNGLIQKAAQFNIEINDWRDLQKTEEYTVNLTNLKSQEAWLDYLKNQFEGSWALEAVGPISRMYLLPLGVEASFIQNARKYAQDTNIKQHFSQIQKAKKLPENDILQLPEVQALKDLAAMELDKIILYERLVNPQGNTQAYSFKVKYIDPLKMFAPFERNGLPVSGEMEGFSCFSTFFDFLMEHADKWQVSRYKNTVYLQFVNNSETNVVITGNMDNFQITSAVLRNKIPVMETHLSGNIHALNSIAKIYTPDETVTLVDKARIE